MNNAPRVNFINKTEEKVYVARSISYPEAPEGIIDGFTEVASNESSDRVIETKNCFEDQLNNEILLVYIVNEKVAKILFQTNYIPNNIN